VGRGESREPLIDAGRPRNVPSRTSAVTSADRKRVVERYVDGFRTGDHELIHSCLTDDVVWEMPPHFQLSGRAAFDDAIENEATPGLPTIQLIQLVEEGDVVVAEGAVQAELKAGGRIDALFCDVFHFRDDKICRLVTYQVDRRPDDGTRRGFNT
jgi:ketosteroid isomerase-like protein